MIANDQELAAMQERIATFQRILAQVRVRARPEEFTAMASGYKAEIERMQREIMDYLIQPAPQQPAA